MDAPKIWERMVAAMNQFTPRLPTLKQQWITACLQAAYHPATLYTGARKIISPYRIHLTLDPSLTMADAGYTKNKLSQLTRNYLHVEARDAALRLWDERRAKRKYGSVGFTTYNHFVKGDVRHRTPRGSSFGPCIQSVIITQNERKQYSIDIPYRTTELMKKFPADLVFIRDVLLPPFDFEGLEPTGVTFHFANVTSHVMYFAVILCHIENPITVLETLRKTDSYYYKWVIRWTSRYFLKEHEHGILKFSQALRVRDHVREAMSKQRELAAYLRKHHPGYGRNVFEDDDDE